MSMGIGYIFYFISSFIFKELYFFALPCKNFLTTLLKCNIIRLLILLDCPIIWSVSLFCREPSGGIMGRGGSISRVFESAEVQQLSPISTSKA